MMRVAIPSLILYVLCRQCRSRFFAVIDGPLPPCLACHARRWRIVGIWDTRRQPWPPSLAHMRSKEPV